MLRKRRGVSRQRDRSVDFAADSAPAGETESLRSIEAPQAANNSQPDALRSARRASEDFEGGIETARSTGVKGGECSQEGSVERPGG